MKIKLISYTEKLIIFDDYHECEIFFNKNVTLDNQKYIFKKHFKMKTSLIDKFIYKFLHIYEYNKKI